MGSNPQNHYRLGREDAEVEVELGGTKHGAGAGRGIQQRGRGIHLGHKRPQALQL